MSEAQILIMAGGTGGHIYPALAVAEALKQRGATVTWLGTRKGMEAELVPHYGYPIDFIDVAGLRGNGLLGWLGAPIRVARAVMQAFGVIRRRQPIAILGMGGFVTGPGGVAARLSGRPLVIHEQNAIAGLTNRLLAPMATQVYEAFPNTFERREGVETCGNPVREAIFALEEPSKRFIGRDKRLRLLVIGGSLGAVALNEAVPAAVRRLEPGLRPQIVHQSGKRNIDAARKAYEENGVEAQVTDFIDDMAEMLDWADIVLCRAGALTVSELAAAGVGSILVPFPFAVDDHQTANARFLADATAAELVPQDELDSERLAGLLRRYAEDAANQRSTLVAMAQAARTLAWRDAADTVAGRCLELGEDYSERAA